MMRSNQRRYEGSATQNSLACRHTALLKTENWYKSAFLLHPFAAPFFATAL
ncbi:MAG: hypothetical protein KME45_10035 [Stenomitos rutilans HA7619-LM2]|nr:hypothetical protein [Stenomitos rutilans HA7619-LM2]